MDFRVGNTHLELPKHAAMLQSRLDGLAAMPFPSVAAYLPYHGMLEAISVVLAITTIVMTVIMIISVHTRRNESDLSSWIQ